MAAAAGEPHPRPCPATSCATLPERLQELLGYNIYPPFLGYVDGRHPRRTIAGARPGPAASLTVPMDDGLRAALEAVLGARLRDATVVHGGDVAAAYRVDLDDGRRLFAKTHPAPPPGFFTTEARGLTWLREADAVAVPEVVAVTDDHPALLVLEWIDEGRAGATTEADFGAALAALHAAARRASAGEDRRTTGSRGLPNEPAATWAEFYGQSRLLPLARLARDAGVLPGRHHRAAGGAGRPARAASAPPTSRRRGCTATSGPATVSSTPAAGAGWSTRPPTAATASSTSP